MDWNYAVVVFTSIFLAELGDKTQIATMLFATDRAASPVTVFVASAAALILTSALGVLAGAALGRYIDARVTGLLGGALFIVIGAYTIWKAW